MQVELRVINRDFTQELEDPTSAPYIQFVQDFTRQVKTHLGSTWRSRWMHPKLSKSLCGVLGVHLDGFFWGGHPK